MAHQFVDLFVEMGSKLEMRLVMTGLKTTKVVILLAQDQSMDGIVSIKTHQNVQLYVEMATQLEQRIVMINLTMESDVLLDV